MTRGPGPRSPLRTLLRDTYRAEGLGAVRWPLSQWWNHPTYQLALRRMEQIPQIELADLTRLDGHPPITLEAVFGERPAWSLGAVEKAALMALVHGLGARRILEIGTFDGGTTAVLAEAVGPDGRVVTVDLPEAELDALWLPENFGKGDIGRVYRSSPYAERVTEIRTASTKLSADDLGPPFDLVFVDGAHDYPHGRNDADLAAAVVAPGGLIVFDDFHPHFSGLVLGVFDSSVGRRVRRLTGTQLAVVAA